MSAVRVDVIALIPEGWGICLPCETLLAQAVPGPLPFERGLAEYPPECRADFQRLSAVVFALAERYGDKILLRIWDPRSLQGLAKSIRYGVRRYPAFIVAGRDRFTGWDIEKLERCIAAAGGAPLSNETL